MEIRVNNLLREGFATGLSCLWPALVEKYSRDQETVSQQSHVTNKLKMKGNFHE